MNSLFKVVTFVPRKVWNYTKAINTALEAPLEISKKLSDFEVYLTKLIGGTTGACGIGKGTVDAAEAYACQNGVCFVVSCIGCAADGLQIVAC